LRILIDRITLALTRNTYYLCTIYVGYVRLPRGPHKMLSAGCNLPTPDLHNRLFADFPSRVLLVSEALRWSLTKRQIVTLFYL